MPEETLSRQELLQELKHSEIEEPDTPRIQMVVVSLDGDLYGIRILAVREILKMTNITWLPCTPDYILGVISVRGDIHAVVNLKNFLRSGTGESTEQSRIIVVESKDLVAGILVDEMIDIIEVSENAVLPLADANFHGGSQYIEGKLQWDESMVALLRLDAIIKNIVVDQV